MIDSIEATKLFSGTPAEMEDAPKVGSVIESPEHGRWVVTHIVQDMFADELTAWGEPYGPVRNERIEGR